MKALPFVLVATIVVGGVLIYFLLSQRKQQAKVIEGVPTISPAINDSFVDEVAGDLGYGPV